jgi:hypothetical protein
MFTVRYSKGKLTLLGLTILNEIILPPNVNSGVEEESRIVDVALELGLLIYLKIEFVP